MANLKKIISRQLRVLIIVPILVVISTLIYSQIVENKSVDEKSIEAKFMWELYHLDTRGIVVKDDYLVSQIFIANPKSIETHIITNIDGFIVDANNNNCKLEFDDWLKAKFVIKGNKSANIFTLDLNEFDSSKVLPCKDFVHDYLVEYISEMIQEFIRIDKEEMNLLSKSMDIYKNRLKSTLENFESIFSTEVFQKQIFQERYFGQYISYLSQIETEMLNLSVRIAKLENLDKRLNLVFSSIKESEKYQNLFLKVLIALIFSIILSILYIAVIESKTIGRYFR